MADLLLAPIIDATLSKVIVVASEQFNLAVGWKSDLERFRHIMGMLQAKLQDADMKNVLGSHSDLKPWLLKLRAIADEADDVLEEVAYENMRRQFADRRWKKVRYLFTLSNPLLFGLRMSTKVKSLNSRLADINANATQLGLQYKLATMVIEPKVDPQQTNSFLSSQVVGRKKDVSKIESLLLSNSTSEQDFLVIAIVGMPGLGKTTLAKAVSKTDKIREKFGENVLWVSVSKNFDPLEILKMMLESLGKREKVDLMSEEAVMGKIKELFGEKNYFLILDDVWNEERQKWEWLRDRLLGVSKTKGNRVLVTTRSKYVAEVMTRTGEHIHSPEVLANDECWTIIKQRAFESSSVAKELEEVGVEIARKCQGIPLVASLTGATLQHKSDKREWQLILKNQVWQSLGRENGVLGIIEKSYDRLPELALKRCFAFCSLFPKGSVMEKEMLIQLWMAVGFLQSSKDCHMEMEDVGDKYFRCLLSYSLFQEEQRDKLGRVISCKMHDLIHDFAESISSFETVILKEDSGSDIPGHVRHLNFTHGGETGPANLGDIAPNLQTLFSKQDFSNAVQTDLKRLRILDLCNASDVKQLQTRLRNSKCLRYLDISGTKVEEFPKFAKKLYNLQTFRFMNCRNLKMPSEGLCNLKNLRHVYFDDEDQMPANLGRLTNLHTLQLFVVGASKGRRIEELGSLSKLKGRLKIRKLECVKGKSEAERAKLHEKAVDELLLSWSYDREEVYDYDDDILEGLRPHSDLQRLKIKYFGGESLPSWMFKSLRGYHFDILGELQLQYCRKLKSIPVMEGFKSLQLLSLKGCDELIDGAFAFQSLVELLIEYCERLETLTISGLQSLEKLSVVKCGVARIIGDYLSTWPCLKVLQLIECNNLEFLPSLYGFPSLQNLEILDNEKLVHLPSGLSSCTALEVLSICDCENLVSISEELKELRSLVDLQISECPKLSSFPEESLGSLTSLKRLWIGGFANELEEFPGLGSIHNLHASLKKLSLYGWENLTQLPHQIAALTSLNSLWISDFGVEVIPEWLGNLTSLTNLSIDRCPKVKSFPEDFFGRLTCLKSLDLGPFSEDLEEYIGLNSIHHLHGSLKELTLSGWLKLTELPHQIQHLTALEDLTIEYFPELEALPDWLGDVPSLRRLKFYGCDNLKHLPSAQVIERLSKLKYFYIDWPELEGKINEVEWESTSGSE